MIGWLIRYVIMHVDFVNTYSHAQVMKFGQHLLKLLLI